MKIPFNDLKKQYISIKTEVDNAIRNVIEDTAFIKGHYVKEFEDKYAEAYCVKHVISCGNGTDAIFIALKALGVGPGDEVITTSSSWISTSEAVTLTGAKIVFVDINPDFYTIDTDKIEQKITENTKAIIPVHIYGHPADMSKIVQIAKKHNLKIIEDCAQAHFAQWGNKNVGTFGDFGTFSFFPGKNLGAYGDAGCITTNDDQLAYKARIFANHGGVIKHQHEIEGINSRMDGLQAAILTVKLKYIHKWTELRIRNAMYYNSLIDDEININIPIEHQNAKHVFHLYVIKTKYRDKLMKYLNKNSISTGIHYPKPLPFVKAYKYMNSKKSEFPVAVNTMSKILSLPIYPELTNGQIKYVTKKIKECINELKSITYEN